MLKEINYQDTNKSVFICDRCKEVVNWDNKNSILVGEHKKKPLKKWDLCDRCYKALKNGIAKGKQ